MRVLGILVAPTLSLTGCVSAGRTADSAAEASSAEIPGFTKLRAYLDTDGPLPEASIWAPVPRRKIQTFRSFRAVGLAEPSASAFWTQKGTRPNFDVVTGVSSGALIAPYAFLGSAYDGELVRLYTSGIAESLAQAHPLPMGLLGDSLFKQEPLRALVEQNITGEVLAAIAAQHRKGRRLLVLTSNLDSQRAVVWNMGAIADSGRPDALELFRQILIASASVPGIYPAVMIKATAQGRSFEEMHSDGGSSAQFLAIPETSMTRTASSPVRKVGKTNMYVIINDAR